MTDPMGEYETKAYFKDLIRMIIDRGRDNRESFKALENQATINQKDILEIKEYLKLIMEEIKNGRGKESQDIRDI